MPQLHFGTELIALVKPMFELHLDHAPTDASSLAAAIAAATAGIHAAGWEVVSTMTSPVRGGKGAVEGFVYARSGRSDTEVVSQPR